MLRWLLPSNSLGPVRLGGSGFSLQRESSRSGFASRLLVLAHGQKRTNPARTALGFETAQAGRLATPAMSSEPRTQWPSKGLWRNGSASDSRSEGWDFESLWPQFLCPKTMHSSQPAQMANFRAFGAGGQMRTRGRSAAGHAGRF